MKKIKVLNQEGKEILAPVVGSYGWEEYPVVLVDGEEYVADECFVDNDGHKLESVCQSGCCDRCSGSGYSGCRHGEYADCQRAWVI